MIDDSQIYHKETDLSGKSVTQSLETGWRKNKNSHTNAGKHHVTKPATQSLGKLSPYKYRLACNVIWIIRNCTQSAVRRSMSMTYEPGLKLFWQRFQQRYNSVISPLVSLRLVITFCLRAQLHIDMTLDNPFYMDIISLNIAWQILSHNTFPRLCDCLFLRQPISKDCVTYLSRKYVLFSINLTTVYRLLSIVFHVPSTIWVLVHAAFLFMYFLNQPRTP